MTRKWTLGSGSNCQWPQNLLPGAGVRAERMFLDGTKMSFISYQRQIGGVATWSFLWQVSENLIAVEVPKINLHNKCPLDFVPVHEHVASPADPFPRVVYCPGTQCQTRTL